MENSLMNSGALFFIGALILIIVSYQFQSAQLTNEHMIDARNHAFIETMRLLLRREVAMIGQEVNSGAAIINARKDFLSYRADIDSDGIVDTVGFFLEEFEKSPFENRNIKRFVKNTNGNAEEFGYRGISNLEFYYFDENGRPTTSLNKIKFVGFKMTLESSEKISNDYQHITIEERLLPKNLWM